MRKHTGKSGNFTKTGSFECREGIELAFAVVAEVEGF